MLREFVESSQRKNKGTLDTEKGLKMISLTLFLSLLVVITSNGGQISPTEVGYCCKSVSDMEDCHSACMKFGSSCPPTVQNKTDYLKEFCSEIPSSLDDCLSNANKSSSQSEPTPSPELTACCGQSKNQACKDICLEQIYNSNKEEAILAVIAVCGPPITFNPDDIWSCFFDLAGGANGQSEEVNDTAECTTPTPVTVTDPPLTITYADWARLQCCSRANTTGCREACQLEYSGNRIDNSWEKLNLDCVYQPNEVDLSTCLSDVNARCTPGCSEMSFCENFNNRPLQLFRSCNKEADDEAKKMYERWALLSTVNLPLVTIQTEDIATCLPSLWKAAACAIYTQPCDNRTHSTILCRDYCLLLMRACSKTKDKTPEEICNILSPLHLQDRCVSFGQFTAPSPLASSEADSIYSPCLSNPCAQNRQCIVNDDCSGNEDHPCIPYSCVEESVVGTPPEMTLVALDVIHVTTLPKSGKRCFGFVQENNNAEFGTQLVHLSNQYCEPVVGCSFNGEEYDYGKVFNTTDGCNFCTCSFDGLVCTRQSCIEATVKDLGETPLLSCDCPTHYQPVCTRDGRTLPNKCIATCLGYALNTVASGSCVDKDPCDSSSCPKGTKCVPHRHVCLSESNHTVTSCPQFTCESYSTCGKFTSPVCDTSGSQHKSLCDFFFTQQKMDYFGYCQRECTSGRSVKVCGVNGETYQTKCHALQEEVVVDYIGNCADIPSGSHGCDAIKCPGVQYFGQHEVCDGPVPPGACCKQCGAMVTVIIDEDRLKNSRMALNGSSINSTDVIARMRDHMKVLDCRFKGYVALDGSLIFLLIPSNYSLFINVEACNMEALRLATLINNHTPVLAIDPFLHFLVAANPSLAVTKPAPSPFVSNNIDTEPNGCGHVMAPLLSTLSFIIVILVLSVLH